MKHISIIRTCAMLLAFALGIALCSCKTQYVAGETIRETVEIHHRDTTIVVEPDSAAAIALLHCDSNYQVVLGRMQLVEGERMKLQYQLNHFRGTTELVIECSEDSLRRVIALQEKEINRLKETTVIQYVKQKDFFWYAGTVFVSIMVLLLIGGIIVIIIRILK